MVKALVISRCIHKTEEHLCLESDEVNNLLFLFSLLASVCVYHTHTQSFMYMCVYVHMLHSQRQLSCFLI